MSQPEKAMIGVAERAAIFHDAFDYEVDPGVTLAALVRAGGDYLAMIVGSEAADAGMAEIVAPLAGQTASCEDWRAALDENESACFSEWPLGRRLHDLVAYARFGIAMNQDEDAAGREQWLNSLVEEAIAFRDRSPLAQWLPDGYASQLAREITLAEGRWALDNGHPVEPSVLAVFGGVSDGRLRNLMSGSTRHFTQDRNRKIPAHEALAWLADRSTYWPSIWRDQHLPGSGAHVGPPVRRPVFVPVARDGSVFHPGLKRGGTYTIGERENERHLPEFEEALDALQKMSVPYWRRPNELGNWGLVGGVRWERLDWSELEDFAANPQRRIRGAVVD